MNERSKPHRSKWINQWSEEKEKFIYLLIHEIDLWMLPAAGRAGWLSWLVIDWIVVGYGAGPAQCSATMKTSPINQSTPTINEICEWIWRMNEQMELKERQVAQFFFADSNTNESLLSLFAAEEEEEEQAAHQTAPRCGKPSHSTNQSLFMKANWWLLARSGLLFFL